MGRGVAMYADMVTVFVDNEQVYGAYLMEEERYEGIEHEDDYRFRYEDFIEDVRGLIPAGFSATEQDGPWDRDTECRIISESDDYQVLVSDEEVMFGLHTRIDPRIIPEGFDADTTIDELNTAIAELKTQAVRERIEGASDLHIQGLKNEIKDIKRFITAITRYDQVRNQIHVALNEHYHLRVRDTAWTTREYVPQNMFAETRDTASVNAA